MKHIIHNHPFFFIDSDEHPEPFCIYNGQKECVPSSGFHGTCLILDGHATSDLIWEKECEIAQKAIDKGLKIFWHIDLGLFSRLSAPLSDQMQFLSLELSLKHFGETIWQEFSKQSIGLSLYAGTLDFSQNFIWGEIEEECLQEWLGSDPLLKDLKLTNQQTLRRSEQGHQLLQLFCADVCCDFLKMLAAVLPDNFSKFVLLDTSAIQNSFFLAKLLHNQRFGRLKRAITEGVLSPNVFIKNYFPLSSITCHLEPPNWKEQEYKIGICLPNKNSSDLYKELNQTFDKLIENRTPFKIVSEDFLTTEWEGLDQIIVGKKAISPVGERKLRGFVAAGGTVMYV